MVLNVVLHVCLRGFGYSLATVNFFLGCVGVTQVTRILLYQQSVKNGSTAEIVTEDAKDMGETVKEAVKDAADKVKSSVQ